MKQDKRGEFDAVISNIIAETMMRGGPCTVYVVQFFRALIWRAREAAVLRKRDDID